MQLLGEQGYAGTRTPAVEGNNPLDGLDMSTLTTLRDVFGRAGVLVGVREHRFQGDANFVTRIDLSFDDLAVAAIAESEFDTIALVSELPELNDEDVIHVATEDLPWSAVVGSHVRWGWILKNHQGYDDGIQLEFATMPEANGVTVQLVVEASSIKCLEVTRCSQQSPASRQ